MPQFSHLHVHTQYSLLDGATNISNMMKKAQADNMPAVALTDHGNMFGAFKFVAEASKYNVKPIVGCEFYLVADRHKKQFSKEDKDNRNHQLLLAKDQAGYRNLAKLCSIGYLEGMYSKWPRIDKEILLKYHEGLIATTCCIGAEVPQAILNDSEEKAEELFRWWLDVFGDDYYVELQRHKMEQQEKVNAVLLRFAKKYNVKVIASNDAHYLDRDDFNAHDVLLCVNTGELKTKPVWKGDGFGGKEYRFGFPNDEFYFKSTAEMGTLFKDLPEALDNTNEIVDKITPPKLKRDILLPNFPIPREFPDADAYLQHLSFEGAKKRYNGLPLTHEDTATLSIPSEVEERINHELHIIKTMGFAGYFLIVQDFINEGRRMGVAVGPGRGSAAGSCVAYCIGITNIDPIKYSLLFERFLNPERISMPDVDVDFDDEGRQRVIDYVVDKYGKNQVAQIITYGSMAAKMSIKDVARVLDLPLAEANRIANLVPANPGMTLKKAFEQVPELVEIRKLNNLSGEALRMAEKLEGSVRGTGIHAAGVIIAPDDITDYIPVCTAKDADLMVTQFDGKVIEDAGMLKMDFLGLKTLTIIKKAIDLIEQNHGVKIDPDQIPLDDAKTYELYQRGDTVGTFQFESEGMRMYLKDLKPTNIEDLVAMNALYRPGPMQFIPNFVERKHGREPVEYPHPLLEEILKDTQGIMVYQEQIMQTAQILAGYSLGAADLLRRAMGKKKLDEMAKQREIFIKGAKEKHDIPKKKAEEVFDIMEKFAAYGFNRSHSAAYSVVAFQTGYLKANYPAEYMAAVLTNWIGNIEKITFFMEECKRMGIPVLGPDVNESSVTFSVNQQGQIRFGLGAIKGAGEAAVHSIIEEREKNGPYTDLFDFARRVNLRAVNKKTFESLAYAGSFDAFGLQRSQYFYSTEEDKQTLLEKAIRYGNLYHENKNNSQQTLFASFGGGEQEVPLPRIPQCEPWGQLEKLKNEKDVVGFFISGHPLDQFRLEIESFCTCSLLGLEDLSRYRNQEINIAGIVTKKAVRMTKNGDPFAIFTLEDYDGATELFLFGDNYVQLGGYVEIDRFLFVRCRVEQRRGTDQWQLRPLSIELLNGQREKRAKGLRVRVPVQRLNPELFAQLEEAFTTHPGQCQLNICLQHPGDPKPIELISRRFKVVPSNELIDQLTTLGGLTCEVIT
ncbi:DNA polymerase-3 subunit alpha [Catalinimonas alkaloidigena]|uniref:DNA polymerase III subunit alpha n=1 Tax=Catalinimonas alkaloidigena TaxID=1075417 RepID=A0A1G8XLN9_9BACT|nr:DNA polymerase III subunit alpha [Catalinimonas alkaloidigena]SDJ90700.1 DNA polymerase-3 subunit alpha [Catalinimonas alkaloidigena]